MFGFSFLSDGTANSGSNSNGGGGVLTWVFVGLLVILVAVLLIVPMFTNKKRAKQTQELHNSLQPGDVVKTVGGIIGTIKEIKQISPTEREMVIETGVGDNKTTMTFDIQALYQVVSRVPAPESNVGPEENNTQNEAPAPETAPVADVKTEEPVAEQPVEETPAAEEAATEAPAEEPVAEEAVKEEEAAAAVEEPAEAPAEEKPAAPKKKSGGKKSTKK